jgi:hypothetical protein
MTSKSVPNPLYEASVSQIIIGYTEELFTGQINNYIFNLQIIVNIGRNKMLRIILCKNYILIYWLVVVKRTNIFQELTHADVKNMSVKAVGNKNVTVCNTLHVLR